MGGRTSWRREDQGRAGHWDGGAGEEWQAGSDVLANIQSLDGTQSINVFT